MATFRFLNAVRDHEEIEALEKLRGFCNRDIREWCDWSELYPPSEALRFAVMYGHKDYVKHLLKYHSKAALVAPVCCTLLILAVRLNQLDLVELICQAGRNLTLNKIRPTTYINSRGCDLMENGKTALHTAVELGHVECTRTLLRYGACPKQTDCTGYTPLERALFRFKPTPNMMKCIGVIIRCDTQLQPNALMLFKMVMQKYPGASSVCKVTDNVFARQTLEPSPLEHLCACTIRNNLQRPSSVWQLPLPKAMKSAIDLQLSSGEAEEMDT